MGNKKLNKALNVFQTVEAIIGVLIILALLLPVLLGYEKYVVLTGSMEPTISPGTLVYVKKNYDLNRIQKGDIIAFYLDDDYIVTHRVEEVHNEYFRTKGDANDSVDEKYVYQSKVLGPVKFSIPYVGNITPAFKGARAIAIVSVIILANLAIVIFLSFSEKAAKKKEIQENQDLETASSVSSYNA